MKYQKIVSSKKVGLVIGVAIFFIFACPLKAKEVSIAPNPSFEEVMHVSQVWKERATGFGLKCNQTPWLFPIAWKHIAKPNRDITIGISEDLDNIHSGKRSLYIMAATYQCQVQCRYFQVNPEVTYTLSLWAKGGGKIRLSAYGMETKKRYPELKWEELSADWRRYSHSIIFPEEVRTVQIAFVVGKGGEAYIDDVNFSFDTDKTYLSLPPTQAFKKDEHTLFLANFEEGWEGLPEVFKLGELSFTKGKFGQGLSLGELGVLFLPSEEYFNLEEGTIEMWFKPNWEGMDKKDHNFLSFPGGNGFYLMKDKHDHISFSAKKDWKTNFFSISSQAGLFINHFGKGDWHHIAATWKEKECRLYLNGVMIAMDAVVRGERIRCVTSEGRKPLELVPMEMPSQIGPKFVIGSQHKANSSDMVIDEVRISDIARYGP